MDFDLSVRTEMKAKVVKGDTTFHFEVWMMFQAGYPYPFLDITVSEFVGDECLSVEQYASSEKDFAFSTDETLGLYGWISKLVEIYELPSFNWLIRQLEDSAKVHLA